LTSVISFVENTGCALNHSYILPSILRHMYADYLLFVFIVLLVCPKAIACGADLNFSPDVF